MTFAVGGFRLHLGTPTEPQAGFLPFVAGIAMMALSAALVLRPRARGLAGASDAQVGSSRGVVALVAAMVLYAATLEALGYVVATVILSAIVLRVADERSVTWLLVTSVVATVGSYVLFVRLLGVALPAGWLFRR